MIDKPTAKKIGFYAVAFLIISSLSIMAFINLSGKYDSITGFAAKDKETTNDTNEKPNITTDGIAPTADAAPETAAEIPAANETAAEDENQEKTKKEKNEKNNPPVWKSDVDEFILKGKTVIDLGSYFYDEENDTLAYLFTEPENVAVDIDGSVVTLTPAKYNITTSMTFTATDGEKATSKEIALIVPEKTITGILEYKSGSAYDADNDGYEATTGIIDLTVESSEFSWDADETKLCTRWQTTSIEDGKITTVCYGSAKCCNFIGLEPARDKWNEVFYSTYGQYGAALNNTISAQTIYVDYALNAEEPFAEIYYSGWGELGARYYLAAIDFKNVCVETCTLSGFNDTSYRLIFEIDNAVLSLDTITYSIVEEIKNVIVSLGVEDNEGAESGSYQLYRNNTPINVTEGGVEPDYYDIEVLPAENADAMDKLLIQNADITKPVTASIGIDNVGREITIENVDVTKRYAVNLEEIDFENAVLTATATANSLYKCRQWDFDSEVCFGSWEKIKDLAVGQQYELTLTKDDPGFIEGNVNITTLNLTGLALIKDIPNISINVNSNAVINLSDYFSDIDENTLFTYFEQDGISIVFDKDIATIAADKDIDGVRFTFITANDSGNLAVSNVFAVTISAGQTNASDLRFNFDDEETNITYYMEADGEKIKANYKGALKENRKFGFVFDEKEVEDEIRAKKQKSFDKKIFYEISSSEDYAKSLANPYMLERALEGQFREVVNQIGQTEIRQVKRFLSFEDVFGKEANKGKNGYLSFAKKGKKWVVEFYNLFDLDPSFIDDTDTNWNSGTFRNMFTTGTGTTANLSALNVSGHYGSQIFDGTAVSNWTNITVTLEANYEMEIGRAYNDSNNAKLPYINTSGLVGLWYFNNESGYGENDSLVRDFSPDVNVERAGSARNNGTAFNGTRINKTDYKLGSGAGWFDGVDDYVIMPASGSLGQVYLTLPTWTYSAWIYPRGLGESSFGRIFSIRINGQSATESRVLRLGSTGEFVFTTSMTCTGATATSASNKVLLNTWQFITATFEMPDNNGAGKIFQNGVEIASGTGTCNINSDTDEAFIIGNRIAGDRNFNGSIDEVAIWNRTLSASEIQNLYKRGAYRLNLSVRSCDDSVCSGEAYTQVENFTRGNIQNLTYLNLPNNRYFQYNFTYSNSSAYGVKLNIENVSIDYFISQDFNFTKLVNTTDRVEVPFNNGNFSNTRFNYSIGAIQSNKDSTGITLNGTYQSQVFDLGTTQQFYNISWTEGAYYGEEIGRCVAEDSLITVVDSVIVYDRNNDENKEKRGSQNWQTAAETAASPRDLSNRESLYINVSVPILGKAEVPELADGAVSKTAASPRGVGVRTLRDEIPLLSTQKYNSNYSILSINEFIECQEKNGCKEFTYITSKKKIKDIQEGDYVQSLDEKTGKIVANRVNELVDMGNKTVYELRTESGRSINTTSNHPYLVKVNSDTLNISVISKSSSFNVIKNPSKSSGFDFDLSNLENAGINASGLSWGITTKTTENTLSFGKDTESVKSESLVTKMRPSALEMSANLLSENLFGAKITSNSSDSRNLPTRLLTFSSSRNLSSKRNVDGGNVSTSGQISSVLQGSFDMSFGQGRKIFNDFLSGHIAFEHLQYLPNHDPSALESGFSMADLAVSDYVFVDFDSHEANNDNIVFKAIATDNAAENLSYDNLNISNEIIEINGVNAKWVWVENLSIGDYIAVPDYENNTVKWERVTGIAALDEQQVYDLNIEGTHNFIANDIIAHNTGSDSNNPPTSNGIFPNISINTSGLVGLWYFNNESGYGENDSLVRDFSPDVNAQRAGSVRNNGTCVINATPTCPVYNFSDKRLGRGAMRFDGVNDFVDAGSDTSLDNLGPLTYSAWVNANSLGGSSEGRIISKETTSSLTSAFFLGGSKRLVFQRQHSTTALAVQSANNAVTLNNTWQHVVMTWDGSTSAANGVKFYVDGVEKAHGFNQDGDGSLTSDAARSLAIGGMYQDGGKRPFDGLIDEVSVWNRTLSSSEISQLYKRGAYRLNLSVRSCDDASCAGEDYSVNVTNSTKSSISALSNNRYVQYKAFFTSLKGSSENSTAPELYNVTVHYAAPVPQSPVINLNYTIPTYPMYNKNVTIIANVTDADANLLYVNFTLYAPNGSIINLTNASRVNDLHNASFNLTSYGTWLWNVTAFDSGGLTVKSSTGVIILMQINESLNASSVAASSPVAVYGHINLSNGSNASNTPISVFINEILANLTVNPSMNFGNLWDNTSFEYRTRINFNETTNLSRTFEHIKINISLAEGRLMNENGTNLFCNGSKIPFDAYALSNSNGWITKLEGLAELNFTQMENKTCYLYYGPDFNGTEITPNDGKGWDYAVQIVTHTCGTQQDISIGNNCTLSNITEWNFGSVTLCGSSDNIIINTWCYYKSTSTGTQSFQTCSDDGSELYANSTLFVNNAFCQAETCVTNSNAAVSDGRYYAIKSRFDEGGGGEVFRVRLAGTELLDTECFRYFGGDWQINASYGTEENIFRTDKYGNYNFTFNAPSSTATYNVKVNSTWANTIPGEQTASFTVADTTPPTVNTTFNVTNALVNSVVNFTGNVTDETGLSTANITYNVSGIITYVNFTLSGTSAQVSNVTTISAGGVYNFTLYVTDTSNNVRQNSTLLVVIDNEFTSLVNTTTRTIFGYGSGNLSDNVRYNATIGAIHTNKDATGITLNGTYQSQVFDLGTTQQFYNISWTEGAYYGEELGRTFGDSNNPPVSNGIFPNVSINTSGLVGLWYFNNESGYGENNSLVRDFSLDVNSERSGSVRNNGTAVNGAHYNFSDKILGRGAMDFDGVDDLVQAPDSASLDAITYNTGLTLSVWIRPAITYDVRPDGFATYALRRSEQFHLSYSGYDDGTVFIVMNAVGVKSIAYDFDPILQGQWYHFVGTLGANNGVLTLYKNGRFVSSASGLASMGTGTTFDIGSYGGTDYEFNGLIDEVSVWNRTLSSAEISQLYKRGAYRLNLSVRSCDDASCAGEDYSVNATNSTSSSISNLANNRYVQYKAFFTSLKDSVSDNSTAPELYNVTVHYAAPDTTPPKFTGNSTNLTTPVLNNTAAFSINASDGVGLQNVIFAWNGTSGAEIGNLSGDSNNGMLPYINTSGLVLLYHFNNQSNYGENDTNVTDFSVYVNAERFGSRQNNGSVYNGAHYNFTNKTLGKGAMDFDGVDDYVDAGTGNSLDAPNAFTISAWFKFMGTPDAYMAGKNRLGNPTTYNYQIQYFEGVLYNSMSQSGGTDLDLGYTWTPVLGRWYYILANYNGNDQKLYIDGQQVASINRGAITLETGSTFILNIGRRSDGTFYFNGSIDEVAIWNRSLSSAEIKELYARGNKFTNVSASGILPASTTSLNWTINYTLPQTGVVGWQFTANDTSGNMMQTDIFNFTVNAPPDTTKPKFTGNSTNLSTPVLNNTAAFSINVSDGVGLQNVIFAWNGTSGAEIGNISADSSNGIWPGINTSGLVGLWHFNNRSGENDTLFKDFSPDVNSERSGSFRNNASCRLANGECPAYNLTDKKFGQSSVDFDGVNNLINVTDDPSLEPQNITVSVWFKRVGNQQAFGKILAKGNGAAAPYASYKFEFNNDVTGSSIVWHTGYTDTTATTITLSPINNNQWHHIVGIYDTGVSRAYLDGNLMGSSIDNKNIFYDTVALSLGAHNDFYGYLNGTIDEVAIWNRSLSSSEIKELYARGNKFTNVSATGVLPASTTSLNWTYNITLPQTGVVAWQFTANDTSGNMMQSDVFNFTVNAPAPPDTTLPIVNTTFNISSPLANDVINFTGNVTDETGLSSANITYNISGIITYVNFTLSGTTGQVSNATKLPSTSAVINFTMYVTDTSNNVRQNSTLLVVTDNEFTSLVNTTTRTIFGYGSGNLSDNVRYNATIGAIHTNKDATGITLNGTYQSQVFDLGTTQSFKNISWTSGAYYGEEIGRCVAEDSLITVVTDVVVDLDTYINECKESEDKCKGRVAQWIEPLSHSRGDAGSSMIRKSRRAHTDSSNNNEKEENQAHNLDKAPVSLTGISHEFFLDSEIAESHTLDNIDTGDYLNVSILDNQDAYSDYSVIPINEFRQICPSLDCNVVDYITSKKKIKDIQEGDYVQSLDEKTGKIVANRVNELVDMGNKTVYELRTESGRSINTTSNHPYLVKLYSKEECDKYDDDVWNKNSSIKDNFEENGYCTRWVEVSELKDGMEIGVPDYEKERIETQSATAKPSSLSAQVLPFISSENFSRNCKTNGSSLYHTGGCTRRTRIAGNLEGGNNEVFKKSLSRVNIALDSLHASEYSLEFLTPFTAYLMSTPLFDKDLTNLASTSSSARNLSFNMDKSFTSQSLSCIVQGCFDVLLSQRRISLENVLETFSSFEHFQDRMNHNSGAFESGLSVADFAVRDNKFIDFGSHEADSGNLVFKDIGIKFERIESIKALDEQQVYDLNIEGTHNFIANDIIAHNTGSDSNNPPVSNGIFPNVSINTSGLVGLWYFNNESGYGENNSLVRDFSPDVNAQRAGSVRNNGTCVINATPTCPVYNFSDKRLGRGAMRFDGVNDYVQVTGLLGSAATVTLAGWANLNAPDSEGGDLISLGSAVALRLRDPTSGNKTYGVYRYATNWRSVTTPANFDVTGWHHFVYVVNPGASSQILYIDGVQIASTSFSDAISYSLGVNTFIGKDGNGGTVSDFNGLIDEVSIWNRTLSSAEISQLYKRGAFRLNLSVRSCDDAVCAGEDYSVNATNSTSSSISALSNNRYVQYKAFFTSLKGSSENSTAPELYNVTVHYSTPVDTTPPKFTGNSTNLTTPVLNNTAAFSINVSDGVGLQNVIFAWNGTSGAEIGNISADSSNGILPGINTSGLVGLWHFNNQSNYGENDTNVTDFSVYVNAERFGSRQNNGSVYNGAHYNFTNKTLGKGAMDFDGSDDYVDAGSDTSLDGTGSGPMTYSAWIYPKGVGEGADGGIINRDDDTNVGWTNFALQNTASIYFSRDYLTTNLVRGAVNNVITYGAWQHVAVTWDGSATASNVHIYVNGQEVSYESTTNGVDALQVSEAHPIIIGNKLTAERTFNGTIDEVAIWNRSLSSAEIKELYARGNKFTNVSASGTLPASTTSLNWTYNITLPQTGVVAWQFTANDTSGNMMQSDIFNFTVNYPTAANAAPVIKINNATFSADPVAGTSVPILLSFNITDPQGVSDINASKFIINLTLGGLDGQFRFNISGPDANSEFGTCYNHTEPGPGSEAARMIINCTLLLMYYDNASALWTINASIKDISSSAGINDTLRFTYNSLSSISLTYAAVNFSNVFLGQQDVPSSPLTLNNTGNDDFDMINITASALVGTSITTESIAPTNFYVNITNQTAGAGLQLGAAAVSLIEFDGANFGKNASLVHGHTGAFAPNADKGNRTIFFWVDVPSGGLSSQLFNATWNVTVSG